MDLILDVETFIAGDGIAAAYGVLGPGQEFLNVLRQRGRGRVYIAGVYELQTGSYKFFLNVLDLYHYLSDLVNNQKKSVHIWGHKINFDITTIVNHLKDFGIVIKYSARLNQKRNWVNAAEIFINGDSGRIDVIDSLNYYGASLSNLKTETGKGKGEITYTKTGVKWNEKKKGWDYINWETGLPEFESYADCVEYLKTDLDLTAIIVQDYRGYAKEYEKIYPGLERFTNKGLGLVPANNILRKCIGFLWEGKDSEFLEQIFKNTFKRKVSASRYHLEKFSNFGGIILENLQTNRVNLENGIHKIDINSFYGWIIKNGIPFGTYRTDKVKGLCDILGTAWDDCDTCKFFRVRFRGFKATHPVFSCTSQNFFRKELNESHRGRPYSSESFEEFLLLEEYYETLKMVGEFKDLEIVEVLEYKTTKKLKTLVDFLYKKRRDPGSEVKRFRLKTDLQKIYGILSEQTYTESKRVGTMDGGKIGRYKETEIAPEWRSSIGGAYISQVGSSRLIRDILKLSEVPGFRLLHCHTDSVCFVAPGLTWKKKIKIGDKLGEYKIEIQGANWYLSPGLNRYLIFKDADTFKFGFSSQVLEQDIKKFIRVADKSDLFNFFDPFNNIRVKVSEGVTDVDGAPLIGKKWVYTNPKMGQSATHELTPSMKLMQLPQWA